MWWALVRVCLVTGGLLATLVFYAALFVVQTANADMACETWPQTVPGAGPDNVRGINFEHGYLNLGGRCTYHMDDGSVVVTREPGWGFSGTIVGAVCLFAGLVALLARRKGHRGYLFALAALVAPPLGFALALVKPRHRRAQSTP